MTNHELAQIEEIVNQIDEDLDKIDPSNYLELQKYYDTLSYYIKVLEVSYYKAKVKEKGFKLIRGGR